MSVLPHALHLEAQAISLEPSKRRAKVANVW